LGDRGIILTAMAKRARVGDVLEVVVPEGKIYLHYLGAHPEYGDGVAVCPTIFQSPVAVTESLFRDSYFVFYPARAAVSRRFASVIGQLPSPGLPGRLRRPGAQHGSKVETWIIEEDSREEVKRQLSDEELRLPVAVIWNHEFLVQRVLEGWRPEHEGRSTLMADDHAALEELRRSSRVAGPHVVLHYLYFPRRDAAGATAAELRARGFATEERLGADGVNWLVLARHQIVPSEETIAGVRPVMEDLARRHGGEYDGWETEVT
jgi:hypothetical protein